MQHLLEAIQTQFNSYSGGSLLTTFPRGLYFDGDTYKGSLPTCSLKYVTGDVASLDTAQNVIRDNIVQINVWDVTDLAVTQAIEAIRAAFQFVILTITGATCIRCAPISERIEAEDDQVFHGVIVLSIWTQEVL